MLASYAFPNAVEPARETSIVYIKYSMQTQSLNVFLGHFFLRQIFLIYFCLSG